VCNLMQHVNGGEPMVRETFWTAGEIVLLRIPARPLSLSKVRDLVRSHEDGNISPEHIKDSMKIGTLHSM